MEGILTIVIMCGCKQKRWKESKEKNTLNEWYCFALIHEESFDSLLMQMLLWSKSIFSLVEVLFLFVPTMNKLYLSACKHPVLILFASLLCVPGALVLVSCFLFFLLVSCFFLLSCLVYPYSCEITMTYRRRVLWSTRKSRQSKAINTSLCECGFSSSPD